MPELPYRVESLDDVPESAREFYEEDDGAYRLPVAGVKSKDEIEGLQSALAKVKRKLSKAEQRASKVSDEDLEDLERLRELEAELEEQKAKDEGRLDEWKAEFKQRTASKFEKDLQELQERLQAREQVVEQLTVTNALRSAIAEAGVDPKYHEAVEHLLRNKHTPKVDWGDNGEMPRGVFRDDIEGDVPITDFVSEWVKTDAASPYMPRETGAGGGGSGAGGGGGTRPSWEGKKYSDMTKKEKIEYNRAKYGTEAA